MSHYDDEAQVEQLRRWWRENWMALAAGLVIGLGGIFGWEAWQDARDRKAGQASQIYEDLKQAMAAKPDEAASLGKRLMDEFGATPYAAQAALLLAQQAATKADWVAAQENLRWVDKNSGDEGLRKIARLRLARVLWQQGQPDQALLLLDVQDDDAFAALYAELTGDIRLAKGDRPGAKAAYEKAMKLGPAPASREFLRHKLDDLADVATGEAKS